MGTDGLTKRVTMAFFVSALLVLAIVVMTKLGTHRVVCDGYGVMSVGDASHPAVYITPPPGWIEYGANCWGEP